MTASVFYAATKTEMAMVNNGPTSVEQRDDGTERAIFTLYTINDAAVHFEVQRQVEAETGEIEAICRVGRFSDRELEQMFIVAFKKRLSQLEGKDFVPLR